MQLLPFFSTLALAFAGQSFNALLIRCGSQYQYSLFTASGSDIIAGSGEDVDLVLNSEGSLIDAYTKQYVNVGDDNFVTLSTNSQSGFSINEEENLSFNGNTTFGICSGGMLKVNSPNEDCLSIKVRAYYSQQTDDVTDKDPNAFDQLETAYLEDPVSENNATAEIGAEENSDDTDGADEGDATASGTDDTEDPGTSTDDPSESEYSFSIVAKFLDNSAKEAPIMKVDEHSHVFSVGGSVGVPLVLVINSDSTMTDQENRDISLDEQTGELGNIDPFGREKAAFGFAIEDNNLTYCGNENWKACPSGDERYSLTNKDCNGGDDITLHVVGA